MKTVVFDLETQNLFNDVGGRGNIGALRVSCGVTWSSATNDYTTYWEKDVPALIAELKTADRVVGFNVKGFDYEVLRPYAPHEALQSLPTLDIMDSLYWQLQFRVSLASVAQGTLNEGKSAEGVQAVIWWREGNLDLLAKYCLKDVEITRRVYEFGCANGFVFYLSRLGSRQKVMVNWKC